MKKNLKKLLSLLTALTILLTMAGIPAMAEGETVDFTAAENIAYGKTITPVAGAYYSSGPKPSATNQKATDGDVTTKHSGYGRATTSSSSAKTGVVFYVDLGKTYKLDQLALYIGQTDRGYSIYKGTAVDEANFIGSVAAAGATTNVNGTDLGKTTFDFGDDVETRYLTFSYGDASGFTYYEMYITGTEVTDTTPDYTGFVAADKAALDLGDLSAVKANLTLPTVGSAHNSTISWSSTDTAVIATDGTVTRGAEDKTVTLTATITNGEATDTKVFTATVLKALPTETIDFSQNNLVYQTTNITRVEGSTAAKFTSNSPKMVDGDITTHYEWSGGPTATFTIDLGAEYTLTDFVLYEKSFNRGFTVSLSSDGTTVTNTKEVTSTDFVQTTVNGTDVYKGALAYTTETARYITVQANRSNSFIVGELLVKGTPVTTGGGTTEPEQPEPEPATKTVDFTETTNVAYQKVITPKAGRDYYVTANGLTKPSATSQLATDGDIATYHMAAGRDKISWATANGNVGVEFSLGFGGNKKITSVDLYVQPIMNDGSNDRDNRALDINVYGGNGVAPETLIGKMTKPVNANDYKSVTANGKTMDMYVYHIDFPADSEYSAITFESSNWFFGYNEIYVTGTEGTTGGGGTTEPEEPEVPAVPTETVNFAEAANVAYGKTITPIAGAYYSSAPKPSATNQKATDGDINTLHSGYGRATTSSSSEKTGVVFSMDLGKEYNLEDVVIYVSQTQRYAKLYSGTSVDESKLLLTTTCDNVATTVNGKENMYKLTGAFPADTKAQYLTFNYPEGSGFPYYEIYIKGTEVTGGGTTDPEEPGIPDGTIDFTSAKNIAYGKTITPVAGAYYSSGPKPSATNQKATDGDVTTKHSGYGRATTSSSSAKTGVVFYVDLGKTYKLDQLALYIGQTDRGYSIYKGTAVDEANFIGSVAAAGAKTNVNGTELGKTTFDFGDDVETRYLTFSYGDGSGFTYHEMYITGTEVAAPTPDYAALVAADKAALDLGNTSAVETNLTLPTVGANGSTITWATSDASVITNTGVITRADENKTATLTATITNGTATDTKIFTVTVAKKEITTVDFKAAKNLAYGKTITPKAGKDYYAGSSKKPSATSQFATDGDITTWHMAAGRTGISWGTIVGSEFNLALEKNRVIKSADLYVQAAIYDSIDSATGELTGNNRSQSGMTINVYGGEDSATGTLIGTMTKPTGLKTITADGKTMDMYIYHIDFPAGAEYDKITFDNPKGYFFGYNEIYVAYEMIDEDYVELVAKDKEALDLGNTSVVISDLALPLVGANGSTITWTTSDASVITAAGVVTRAAETRTATLTATITNGNASDTKTFEIIVLGTDTNDGKVAGDKAALQLGDTSAVTENLTLPTVGANGSTIVWRTNNPAVVEADGTVHRDLDSKRATLTATITYGDAFDTKQFVITVLGTETDEERVASDKETLSIGDVTAVKANLALPLVGAKGTTITWATSDATVITKDGKVTRGDADKTVTLTATIKYGTVTATKVFTVTVLKKVVISGTVDFTAAENVAYNKVATPVSGRHYYAKSSTSPDTANRYTTDGDLTTWHMGAGRTGVSWGTKVGSEFTIDLAETYTVESVDLFAQPSMNDGSTVRSNANLPIYVYGDGNKDTGTLIGKMIIPASTTTISDGTNEMEVYIYHIDIPANSNYSTLSFFADVTYYWGWNEVYVKGESSLAANVVDDKKSIEFGDLNDVVESLTLPTLGAKGSTITWATSDASVIETDGTVHRAEHTKKAKLTATITKGDVSDTKEFLVTVLGTYDNHYVINSDDFSDSNIRYKYVSEVAENSTAAVNTTTNKLELTRNAGGEISVKKYFVTERSDLPYSVIGDKVVLEQLMAIDNGLQGATAEIRNKNDELIATYGIKKEGMDYVFFLNVGGREQSTMYTYGDEIFTRIELITENGASTVKAMVGTEFGVDTVAELPLAASVHPSMTTVIYTANEGSNGKLVLDGVKFMAEGTDKDKIAVTIETENYKNSYITTQNFDEVTRNLSLKTSSIFDCSYSYESSNPGVISKEGFVTRPLEDTPVSLTVTVKKGESSKSLTFDLIVKGMAADNMAMDNLILSSGAIEGSNDKNAIDGLIETAFITDSNEKFFAICFDKATTFNIVTLFEAKNEADQYGVTGFEIQVSDNGNDWETVYTGTTVGEQKTVEFPQVTTNYVRYYITGLTGTQTGLHEIVLTYDPVPEVAIDLDLAAIVITPNNYVVTSSLTLPTEGKYGSVITWVSSHPDILGHDGTLVSVPEKDTVVKLTATLTNGEFTRTKDFTRSVKGSSTGETEEETGKTEKPGGVSGGGGGAGGGGGGGGSDDEDDDPKPVDPTPVDPTPSTSVFKDVASDRWSHEYILELKEAGIVSGDGENFRPTDKVTREEFVKMLVLSLGIVPEGSADFDDVAADAWYHDYIAVAVDKGIVNGLSDSQFGIGRSISRQDMAVMTVRALQTLNVELQGGDALVFTDGDQIADYATEAVETLAAAGILAGSDGKFAPADNLTREQAAKVLCMIRKELTK